MKRCADCKQDLPEDQFTKSNPWYCRGCKNERHKAWYRRKRDEVKALRPTETPKTEKLCKRCGEVKPIGEFYTLKDRWTYYLCKKCSSEVGEQRRRIRNEKGLHGYERLKYRCNKLGVTVDWYERKSKEQEGVCALCGKNESHPVKKGGDAVRSLAIDHDHGTGKVRGLLCMRCNTALYQLELNGKEWAHKAVAYLDRYSNRVAGA